MDRVPNNRDMGGIVKKNSTMGFLQFSIQTQIIKNKEIET
tara:strand:- start:326 stop:445 length:120 start_codon:yes stop_codon:yes gene_type:complete